MSLPNLVMFLKVRCKMGAMHFYIQITSCPFINQWSPSKPVNFHPTKINVIPFLTCRRWLRRLWAMSRPGNPAVPSSRKLERQYHGSLSEVASAPTGLQSQHKLARATEAQAHGRDAGTVRHTTDLIHLAAVRPKARRAPSVVRRITSWEQ